MQEPVRKLLTGCVLSLSLTVPSLLRAGPEWPEFRGPGGQGHAEADDLPLRWSETENVVWKTAIPGRGYSSPVIGDGQIWLTTAIETPISEEEKERRLADNTGNQPLTVSGPVSFRAVCIDREGGEVVHDVEVLKHTAPDPVHTLNSFASPTPVLDATRLFCHFGTNGTACVDRRTGKVLWRNTRLRLAHENGPGSSPISWRDKIIFHCDGSDVQYIVALDKQTGEVAWKTDRSGAMHENPQLKKAYGTPIVARFGDRHELISPAANWLYSYDPDTGEELWKLSYDVLGFSIVPRPVIGQGRIYLCTSFTRSQLLAIRYDGEEVTRPRIDWRYTRQAPQMPSPILVGDAIYIVSDRTGIAACIDARTGEPRWRERLGGNYSASPLLADGKLFFANREGVVTILEPADRFRKLAENHLDGSLMASPVAVGKSLFLRTDQALYRIEKRS